MRRRDGKNEPPGPRRVQSLILALTMAVMAATASATQTWTSWSTIASIEVVGTRGFIVSLFNGVGASCTAANEVYFIFWAEWRDTGAGAPIAPR
jgi:hypothetical protein